MKIIFTVLMLLLSFCANATWHTGKITMIAIGYDGETISVGQEGFSREDCTCYPTWPNRYCLDINRKTHEKEYALLLSAKIRNMSVAININEETCRIAAIFEQ